MRLLAQNISRLGYECALLRVDPTWDDGGYYGIDVPYTAFAPDAAPRSLVSSDVVLLPEYRLDYFLDFARAWPGRKAVYAQGGFLALRDRPAKGYRANGIEFVIAVSPYIAALAPFYLGMGSGRTHYVPYPVVRGPFAAPAAAFETKRLAIAFMPRKLPDLIQKIRDRVQGRWPDVPWIEIDGVAEQEVVRRLDEAAIFLSTQNGEGFGLPAVEAMSRGCLVAGYPGSGLFPHPYANRRNGLWARDRSVRGAASQLLRAIDWVRMRDRRADSLSAEGHRTVERYTPTNAFEALRSALTFVMESGIGEKRPPRYRLGLLGHFQALRALQVSRGLRRHPASLDWAREGEPPARSGYR